MDDYLKNGEFNEKYILSKGKKETGPILRFTELFFIKPPVDFSKDPYVKKLNQNVEDQIKVPVTYEEEESVEVSFEKLVSYVEEKKNVSNSEGQKKSEEKTQKKKQDHSKDNVLEELKERTEFAPLDLIEWENQIIWEDNEIQTQKPPEPKPQNSSIPSSGKKMIKKIIKSKEFGGYDREIEEEEKEIPQVTQPQPVLQTQQAPIIPFSNLQTNLQTNLPSNLQTNPFQQRPLYNNPFSPMAMQNKLRIPSGNVSPMIPGNLQTGSSPFPQTLIPKPMTTFPQPNLQLPIVGQNIFMPKTPIQVAPNPIQPQPIKTQSNTPNPLNISQNNETNKNPIPTNAQLTEEEKKKKSRKKYTRKKKTDNEEGDGSETKSEGVEGEKIEAKQQLNILKIKNESLETDEWLEQIIWDDQTGPEREPNTKLILDLNDKYMIFIEETPELKEKEKEKEKIELDLTVYNISNDKEYENVNRIAQQQKKGRNIVKHSMIALLLHDRFYRTYIPNEELRKLHRPRYIFETGYTIPIQYKPPKKEKPFRRKQKNIEKLEDLSAHNHRVILLEYVEENPPLLNNVGMGTKVVNYFKKTEIEEQKRIEDGISFFVENDDALPLIGTLEDGKTFMSIENSMYSAQIFKQDVPETDFLLTTRTGSNKQLKMMIREIPALYTVGHTQPHIECPSPNSKLDIQFTKNRLMLYIYTEFLRPRGEGEEMRIKIDDIKNTFPGMSETSIRKRLKECAEFQRGGGDSGWWIIKKDFPIPPNEKLLELVTPEMVCMNESMEAGKLRLEENGVSNDAAMAGFGFTTKIESYDVKFKDTIQFIKHEKMNTPWNKTANFINAIEGKEGTRLELLSVANQVLKKDEIEQLSQMAEEAAKLEGEKTTHYQITHEQAKQILLDSGTYTEEKIEQMKRPERKQAARKILESYGQGGRKNAVKENARNTKFREIIRKIFLKEAKKIESGQSYYDSDDEDKITQSRQSTNKKIDSEMSDEDFDLEKEIAKEDDFSDNEKSRSGSDNEIEKDKKKYYVKKTTTITKEDGTKEDVVEIIRDKALVEQYKKKLEAKGQPLKTSSKKKDEKSQTGDSVFPSGVKEKRRVQDQFRRWKKEKEKEKTGVVPGQPKEKKKKERDPNAPPKERKKNPNKPTKNITCGACGQPGHMATNKLCPLYNNSEKSNETKKTQAPVISTPSTETPTSETGGGFKFKISAKVLEKAQEKSKKKNTDFNNDYLAPKTQTKRRRKTKADECASILEKIIEKLKQQPSASAFLAPVDLKVYPEYKRMIQKPIDLSTIHRKISNLEYLDADGFLKDIELMVSNCHTFCAGKFDDLIPHADKLLEIAKEEVAKVEDLLEEIKNAPTTVATVRNEQKQPPKKKKKRELTIDTNFEGSNESNTSEIPSSIDTPLSQTPIKSDDDQIIKIE